MTISDLQKVLLGVLAILLLTTLGIFMVHRRARLVEMGIEFENYLSEGRGLQQQHQVLVAEWETARLYHRPAWEQRFRQRMQPISHRELFELREVEGLSVAGPETAGRTP